MKASFDFSALNNVFMEEIERFKKYTESTISQVFPFESKVAMEGVASGYEPAIDDFVTQFIEDRSIIFSGTNETTSKQVRNQIISGIRAEFSESQIAVEISSLFEQIRLGRAATIARTESASAMNFSGFHGARQTGLKLNKRWLSSRDEAVRTFPDSAYDHLGADGETVKLEEQFHATGEALDYPCDSIGSPGNIINCRCATRFINRV